MMVTMPHRRAHLLMLVAMAWPLAACGGAPLRQAARPAKEREVSQRLEAFRLGFTSGFVALVKQRADPGRRLSALACKSPSTAPYRHPRVLCASYRTLATPALLGHNEKTVQIVLDALDGLRRHAFADPALPALVAEQRRRILAAQRRLDATSAAPLVVPAPPSRQELARLRVEASRLPRGTGPDALLQLVVSPGSPLRRIELAFRRETRRRRAAIEARTALEVRLADALSTVAESFERERVDALRWAKLTARKAPQSAPASQATTQPVDPIPDVSAHLRSRLQRFLSALLRGADISRGLRGLEPSHPQYRRLLGALARYRRYAARGAWPRVERIHRLRRGMRNRRVAALKRRLAAEGYDVGAFDQRVDTALIAAVRDYKEAHQIVRKGLSRSFWRALRRPAKEKVAAIERELRRWRRSKTQLSSSYVLVNLPSFQLELRQGQKRLFREAVVIGRNRGEKCDEETEQKVLAFATPEVDAHIQQLIFSPYWNVTKAIKEKELDAERGKDPLFYEKHGYEIMHAGTPGEWVREMPSPKNALGFVKFIFPNPHAVYVHDTPDKGLFARPIRLFSHGCMRLRSPRSLARLLLQLDGQYDAKKFEELYQKWLKMSFKELQEEWDEERYDKLKKKAEELETKVELKRPIPIHVEYHTVWVDADGRARFLRDIYRRDNPKPGKRCIPESKRARRGFKTLSLRVLNLEILATQIAPRAKAAFARAARLTIATRRWKKRVAALGDFELAHKNLVAKIRIEQQQLGLKLASRRRRWNDRLVEEAVRIERLAEGLEAMQRDAKLAIAYVEKLSGTKVP